MEVEQILHSARDFYHAFKVMFDRNELITAVSNELEVDDLVRFNSIRNDDDNTYYISFAPVVCLAFSVELFLKAILMRRDGKAAKTHNLYQLFQRLSDEDKNDLKQSFFSITNKELDDRDLDRMEKESLSFEHWRYQYELEGMFFSTGFWYAFAKSMYRMF